MSTRADCRCRCHLGGAHPECDVDAGYGVGCGPHDLPADAEPAKAARPATTDAHEQARRDERARATVQDSCAELLALWPHLSLHAVARDSTGLGDGGPRSSADVHASVLNVAVQDAQMELVSGLRKLEAEAVPILKLAARRRKPRPPGLLLRLVPLWHERLLRDRQPLAEYVLEDVQRWARTARRAIGLRTRDIVLDVWCPIHPTGREDVTGDDGQPHRYPRSRLRLMGSDATLTDEIRTGARSTGSFTAGAWRWRHSDTVYCPRCRRRWAGAQQIRMLGRMIEQAAKAAAERAAKAAGDGTP